MQDNKFRNLILFSSIGLGVFSIVALFFSLENKTSLNFWSDIALRLTYLYAIVVALLIIGFGVWDWIKNFKQRKAMLFGVLGVIVLWGLGRISATTGILATPKLLDQLENQYGKNVGSMIQNVDASLHLTYFLLIIAIGALIYSSVVKIFRR